MKNNYWFIKKNYERYYFLLIWLLTVGCFSFCIFRLVSRNSALTDELQARKDVSVHQWIMSDTCSDQLVNSKDGILRIRVNK